LFWLLFAFESTLFLGLRGFESKFSHQRQEFFILALETHEFANCRGVLNAIAKEILNSSSAAIIGGGETTSLFNLKPKSYNLKTNIFLSTGGGAMLEFLGGEKLPGIEVL